MTTRHAPGAYLWSRERDLAVFLAPTLVGLAVLAVAPRRALSDAAWVVLVLAVDVAHVWATLFRTYFDREEIARRRLTYGLVPLGCYALGVALHGASSALFWRLLAYVAVYHFVRQQIGWAAIYRARAGDRRPLDRWLDGATLTLATTVPLLHWHTHLPRPFSWFLEGDFLALPGLAFLVRPAEIALLTALGAFVGRQAWKRTRGEPVSTGKVVMVLATAVSWWGGIVIAEGDLAFTALNVLPHGVPYFLLIFAYARARAVERPRALGSRIVALGAGAFVLTLLAFAFAEETLWDRLLFHDHDALFGFLPALEVTGVAAHLLVPLLALPQATHYALDAVLWRRQDRGPAQARALGLG